LAAVHGPDLKRSPFLDASVLQDLGHSTVTSQVDPAEEGGVLRALVQGTLPAAVPVVEGGFASRAVKNPEYKTATIAF
jgi:hypothetical protein